MRSPRLWAGSSREPGTQDLLKRKELEKCGLEAAAITQEREKWWEASFNQSSLNHWLQKVKTCGLLPRSPLRGRLEFSCPKWLLNNYHNLPFQHTEKQHLTKPAFLLLCALYVFWLLDFGPDGLYHVAAAYAMVGFSVWKGNHYANEAQSWLKN